MTEWDWAETGTRHIPSIQPADVEELAKHGATTVVLSQGMDKPLHLLTADRDSVAELLSL